MQRTFPSWITAKRLRAHGLILALYLGRFMFGTWPRGNLTRVAIVHELNKMPGQQLVLVRYKPHNPGDWE
jgi:hypothetical protein